MANNTSYTIIHQAQTPQSRHWRRCLLVAVAFMIPSTAAADPKEAGPNKKAADQREEPHPQPAPSHGWSLPKKAAAPKATPQPVVLEAIVESKYMGKQHVVFVLPPEYEAKPEQKWPAVLTFAGLGESKRGNKAGAWGWVEMYGVIPAMAALHRNHLTREDFKGLISDDALKAYNSVLEESPYRGVVLVCPYPPQRTTPKYEKYLLEELIPYTNATLRVFSEPEQWGIDGISMGGMLSTYIGFRHAPSFGAFGSQQSSVSYSGRLSKLVEEQMETLRGRPINIATSQHDPVRKRLTALSESLRRQGLEHRFTILQGRHDKRFVKGPGSIELLLFQDRALWKTGAMPPAATQR